MIDDRSTTVSVIRQQRLYTALAERGYDTLLTDATSDILYFTGCVDVGGYLLVSRSADAWLLTSAHDAPRASAQTEDIEVARWWPGEDPIELVRNELRRRKAVEVAVASLPVATYIALQRILPEAGLQPEPMLSRDLRRIKDAEELAVIRQAATIVEAGMRAARAALGPGVREIEVAAKAERVMRRLGSDGRVFETKVESGHRSAWPSTYASEKVIEAGDLVLIDIGPTYRGYFGDLTRTFSIGEPSRERQELLELVLAAQAAGLDVVRAGATGHEVDKAVREVIVTAGHGERILHHTGHTLGLAGDSLPLLAPNQHDALRAGECVTVEPGVYVEGVGGVRIEDEALVTECGHELLTHFEKDLEYLVIGG